MIYRLILRNRSSEYVIPELSGFCHTMPCESSCGSGTQSCDSSHFPRAAIIPLFPVSPSPQSDDHDTSNMRVSADMLSSSKLQLPVLHGILTITEVIEDIIGLIKQDSPP